MYVCIFYLLNLNQVLYFHMFVLVGHTVMSINGLAATGRTLEDGRDILEVLATEQNYPISIKFGRPKLTTNEKIMLAGMFHS